MMDRTHRQSAASHYTLQASLVVVGSGLRRSKLLLTGAELLTLPGAEQLQLATVMP